MDSLVSMSCKYNIDHMEKLREMIQNTERVEDNLSKKYHENMKELHERFNELLNENAKERENLKIIYENLEKEKEKEKSVITLPDSKTLSNTFSPFVPSVKKAAATAESKKPKAESTFLEDLDYIGGFPFLCNTPSKSSSSSSSSRTLPCHIDSTCESEELHKINNLPGMPIEIYTSKNPQQRIRICYNGPVCNNKGSKCPYAHLSSKVCPSHHSSQPCGYDKSCRYLHVIPPPRGGFLVTKKGKIVFVNEKCEPCNPPKNLEVEAINLYKIQSGEKMWE